jgi:hypothetical protein
MQAVQAPQNHVEAQPARHMRHPYSSTSANISTLRLNNVGEKGLRNHEKGRVRHTVGLDDRDARKGIIRILEAHPRFGIGAALVVENSEQDAVRRDDAVSRLYANQLIRDGRAVWVRNSRGPRREVEP